MVSVSEDGSAAEAKLPTPSGGARRSGWLRFLPLMVFGVLLVFLGIGLTLEPRKIPSPLIDRPAPEFSIPRLDAPERTFTRADLLGDVSLVNVWASWCVSCRAEHEVLMALAASGEVPIYGLNYRDERAAAQRWLRGLGNPYQAVGFDQAGRVALDWGVYGSPETYLVDQEGTIRYKHIGPLTPKVIEEQILPLVRDLRGRQPS